MILVLGSPPRPILQLLVDKTPQKPPKVTIILQIGNSHITLICNVTL